MSADHGQDSRNETLEMCNMEVLSASGSLSASVASTDSPKESVSHSAGSRDGRDSGPGEASRALIGVPSAVQRNHGWQPLQL